MDQEPFMNDYCRDGSHVNSIQNEKDSLNEETTGAGCEDSVQNITNPTKTSFIRYKIKDADAWKETKVISLEPKKKPVKYKNWVNIHVVREKESMCVN